MKKFVFFLVLLLSFMLTKTSEAHTPKAWGMRYDRMLHFEFGLICSMSIPMWQNRWLGIKEDYGIISMGLPILAGYFKEIFDRRKVCPELYDKRRWDIRKWTYDEKWDFISIIMGSIVGKSMTYSF